MKRELIINVIGIYFMVGMIFLWSSVFSSPVFKLSD